MRCSHCGHDNRPTAKFCSACANPLSRIQPGQLMKGGTYRVVRPLSKGGMGALYLVEDLGAFGKLRVIKEMLDYVDRRKYRTPADYQQAVQRAHQRFEQEARTLASLSHPGIPDILVFFSEQGRNYIVMEYVDGQDLLRGLTHQDEQRNTIPGQPYPAEDVVRWGVQVCKVLEYLAQIKPTPVIHHDIKPANLVLDQNIAEVRLVDFGTARVRVQPGGQSGLHKPSIYGTAGYAPPEQYVGQGTPKSDVYALAATMYHLLTDDDPGEHPLDFPELALVDDDLAEILKQALENDESQRLDAIQFHQALEQWLQTPRQALRPKTGDFHVLLPTVPDTEIKKTSQALVHLLQISEQQASIWAYAAPRVVYKTRSRSDAQRMTAQLSAAGIAAKAIEVDESRSAALSAAQKQQLASKGYITGLTMARLGPDKRCECHLCGYEWTSRKGTGDLPPATCPQCKSTEWSLHRLFKCAVCGHEFTHADQSKPPTDLFPVCPGCGEADWLPGKTPVLRVNTQKLNLGTVRVGESKSMVLNIANAGKGKLRGVVRCLEPWLHVDQAFGDGGKITLPLDTARLVSGRQYRGMLDIISSGGAAAVEVQLLAQDPEKVTVMPATLDFGRIGTHPPPARTLQIANTGGGILDGTATADQSWIHLSTSRLSGNSLTLAVSVKPAEMQGGQFLTGTIQLKTNGGNISVPVQVTPQPTTLTCIPSAVNLTAVKPSETRRQVVRLINNGAGTLKGRVVSAPDWLRVEPAEWQGNSVELVAEVEGRRLGDEQRHSGVIQLSSNGGDMNLPVQAALQGPTLGISPTALDFGSLPAGWLEKRRLHLTNLGLGSLQGTAQSATPWLRVEPARFSGKNTYLKVSTRTRGLAPGAYRGLVEIDSNGGRARVNVQAELTAESSLPLALRRHGPWVAVALVLLVLVTVLVARVDWSGIFPPQEITPSATVVVTGASATQATPSKTPTATLSPTTTSPTSTPAQGAGLPIVTKTSTSIAPEVTKTPTRTPTATPTATRVPYPTSGVRITWPASGAVLRGVVQIQGTANINQFSYYKFEFRPEGVSSWSYLARSYRPVTNGVLMTWHTTTVSSGRYRLRLVVVDRTGNYPEPYEIWVTIQN